MSQDREPKHDVTVDVIRDGVGRGTINGQEFVSMMGIHNYTVKWRHMVDNKAATVGEASVLARALNKFSKKQALEAVGV